MTRAGARVGVGTHFRHDGETVEVVEMAATTAGNEVVLKDHHGRILRLSLRELLFSDRATLIPEGPGPSSDDAEEIASVVLGQLDEDDRWQLLERAEHVWELLTGYRSGTAEVASEGEPQDPYTPMLPLEAGYAAKAAELGVTDRTIRRWVADYRRHGEAGLIQRTSSQARPFGRADDRWVETALEVMVEHTGQSKPSRPAEHRASSGPHSPAEAPTNA